MNGLFGRPSAEAVTDPFNVDSGLDQRLIKRKVGLAATDYDQSADVIERHLSLREDVAHEQLAGATLEAIRRLAETVGLTDQEREILERTYTLLRTVEHRLQILYDRQTHTLPGSPLEFARLAVRMGYGTGAASADRLRRELDEAAVLNRRILDHLLHDAFPEDATPEPEVDLVLDPAPPQEFVSEVLARHGFRDIPGSHRALMALGEEKVQFLSSRRCRHFLAAIAARLLHRR